MRRYKGVRIEAEDVWESILVGCNKGNRYLSVVWRLTFPDGSWVRCGTLAASREYIDGYPTR
jgi:hypothetical protein